MLATLEHLAKIVNLAVSANLENLERLVFRSKYTNLANLEHLENPATLLFSVHLSNLVNLEHFEQNSKFIKFSVKHKQTHISKM